MQIGFIGLGKMGVRMAEKLVRSGHDVVVWNRTSAIVEEFIQIIKDQKLDNHLQAGSSIQDLVQKLTKPRIIWSMLPAGEATEAVLQEVGKHVEEGDIIIDGGNSHFKDTQRRFEEFQKKGIRFLGVGVSGGVHAPENGFPFMAGGDKSAYEAITPILDSLAAPHGGHEYFGTGGAGHFVKMVHNGIEYGMMQAISEGFGVLEKSPYDLNLVQAAKIWQKETIVSSFLIDRAYDALVKDPKLSHIEGEIDATGEGLWTIEQAKEEQVPIENIEQSLDFRHRSKTDQAVKASFAARMVAALRREFGGHRVKERA